ncbi:MAG: SMC-Scp complex subunit ScpB [Kiloniellaceae bacterium]
MSDRFQHLRLIEALLFASAEPLGPEQILRHLPEGTDLDGLMTELTTLYANRGVRVVRVGGRWAFRTAADLGPLMTVESTVARRPSRAAVETLAIIAYHQPVTRAEIEEIRGVGLSRGTLDALLEAGWIRPKGRRRSPGRPITWGTTEAFLDHFSLESLDSLPGLAELKAAGLLDTRPAMAAPGARGRLPAAGEASEDAEETADEDLLGFGEHLAPRDADAKDVGSGDADAEDVEPGGGTFDAGGPGAAPGGAERGPPAAAVAKAGH